MNREINLVQFNRQMGLIDPNRLAMSIGVLGAGGIGGWTALSLIKMGCQDLTIYDFDTVELHNTGSQIYTSVDENKVKVEALKDKLYYLTEEPIETVQMRYEPGNEELLKHQIIICAVDNITTRNQLFEQLKGTDHILIDGRMAGNNIQIFTCKMNNPESLIAYQATLFPEDEALPISCSEKAVVYNCFTMAGLITSLVARVANQEPLPQELIMDLLNFTLYGGVQ